MSKAISMFYFSIFFTLKQISHIHSCKASNPCHQYIRVSQAALQLGQKLHGFGKPMKMVRSKNKSQIFFKFAKPDYSKRQKEVNPTYMLALTLSQVRFLEDALSDFYVG